MEMPKLVDKIPKISERDESDLNEVLNKSDYRGARKISTLDSKHDIYHFMRPDNPKSQAYLVVERKTKRIKANITGNLFMGEFDIGWAGKHSTATFKMTDVYHHIIRNHITLVSSTEHSPGSYKNWRNLASKPDIEVSAYSSGESVKAFGPEEWHKNYEGQDSNQHKHKLVARAKK